MNYNINKIVLKFKSYKHVIQQLLLSQILYYFKFLFLLSRLSSVSAIDLRFELRIKTNININNNNTNINKTDLYCT